MFFSSKANKSALWRVLTVSLVLAFLCSTLSLASNHLIPVWEQSDANSSPTPSALTVVIDAGHGGEDGGAVSKSGLFEKDLNLQIAEKLCELLKSNGVNVVMTRTEDILLYDRTVDYQGRKKALDLAARQRIAEETPGCIFVSIHMNAYPQSQYRGLQVWYSPNDPNSHLLAQNIQKSVAESLQRDNQRQVKRATSSIYLLHRLQVPAVLVECGFLSNPEEALLLADGDYQKSLALLLCEAIMKTEFHVENEIKKYA